MANFIVNDVVHNIGNAYICILEHNSTTAGSEPGAGTASTTYWNLMAQEGVSGTSGTSGSSGTSGTSGSVGSAGTHGTSGTSGSSGSSGTSGTSGTTITQSYFEKNIGEFLSPADYLTSAHLGGLFEEDNNGDFMPSTGSYPDTFFTLDGSDNIQPSA